MEQSHLKAFFESISDYLEDERHRVNEEIMSYPTPITACDAQFNYLLEQQKEIAQERDRWKDLAGGSVTRPGDLRRIGEFITTSKYINGERRQRIQSFLLQFADDDT